MMNAIKAKLALNAFNKFKLSLQMGGAAKFKISGLKFDYDDVRIEIGEFSLDYNFPMGYLKIEEGKIEANSQSEVRAEFSIKGFKVSKDGDVFTLDEMEASGVSELSEIIAVIPFEELIELDTMITESRIDEDKETWIPMSRAEQLVKSSEGEKNALANENIELKEEVEQLKRRLDSIHAINSQHRGVHPDSGTYKGAQEIF